MKVTHFDSSGHDFSRAEQMQGNAAARTAAGWDEVEYRIATNPGEPSSR